ncbi:protein of unknown function [Bradyrhizobium sp. ORS 285]|uniref:hypothetical protein n=1 Tax=Bradyrhizobium sp. ORS 285 TaxID=115808 RepID=UPI000240959C|nr:hypothetical protein [Bradyrhizobium sp. ORS 285]CCD89856.1 hypothetical protein BRAO285_850061 [Bradyrhizobium sp. ORS 285]SMX61516.1 protein of unknown function [Bradyrhizobium sp. ORS 285]
MTAPVYITWKGTTDISGYVVWDSLEMVSVLTKERGSLKFRMHLKPASASSIPAIGDDITLTDPSGTIFGGVVTSVQKIVKGGGLIEVSIGVLDYGFKLDSKLVKASYTNMDPADIVADIVSRFAAAGFDYTTNVQRAGFTIPTISFNYEQVTRCLEALARHIGWDWYVGPDKKVHFFFATTVTGSSEYNPAPFPIDDTSADLDWPTLDSTLDITNLKNSIYVIGGSYPKAYDATTTPDKYTTVAGQTVYHLAYKYTGAFFVTLDGVVQSVGIDQQDDPGTHQTLYNSTGPFIRFTSDPGSGHTLKVYGNAQIPIVAHVQDSASVAAYGEYQDSIIDAQIKSVAEAQERAQAELVQFGHPVYDVKFYTVQTGARVGQVIMYNSTKFGVSNYPLIIKRIEARAQTPTALRYHIEAIGSDKVTFTDIMLTLLQQQNAQTSIDASTVLQILLDVEEDTLVDDSVTISSSSPPYVYGTARAGFSKYS